MNALKSIIQYNTYIKFLVGSVATRSLDLIAGSWHTRMPARHRPTAQRNPLSFINLRTLTTLT